MKAYGLWFRAQGIGFRVRIKSAYFKELECGNCELV